MTKIAVRITGAVGETEELEAIPEVVESMFYLWNDNQDDDAGRSVLEQLNPYLKANFVPINLEYFEEVVPDDTEFEAIEVILHGFDFDDSPGLPTIAATAIFDLPFRTGLGSDELSQWEEDRDENLGFAFNFYWEFDEEEVFLDTSSGIDWWMADD